MGQKKKHWLYNNFAFSSK